jgi:hypothetical protein
MTALSLAGKGTVVMEKRPTRSALQVPFPLQLNALYVDIAFQTVILCVVLKQLCLHIMWQHNTDIHPYSLHLALSRQIFS